MSRKFLKSIEDKFLRGLIAGLIAGIIKDFPDLFLVDLFKIKHIAFWDYTGVMVFNKIPQSFFEHFLGFVVQVAFSLGLGIIYSVIVIPKFPTSHYLVRGAIYGGACWFALISIIKLYNVNSLLTHDLFTPMATLLFSSCYGLLLGFIDNYFSPQKDRSGSW